MSYNGYKNYESWVVRLWADNDEGVTEYLQELADEHQESESDLVDALKEYYQEMLLEDNSVGLAHDLLSASLDEIDWRGWAQDLIGELVTDQLQEGE